MVYFILNFSSPDLLQDGIWQVWGNKDGLEEL